MNANLFSRKIEMTKTEAKAAGKPNTTEYNTLLELMKNFPGFQIEIVKSAAKKADRFKGLDINYMENYIKSHKPELLETFYELRGLDANGKKVASNADGYDLALSPAAIRQAVGMARSTYHDQFVRLIDKGYLVETGGNTYDFYEVPQTRPGIPLKKAVSADG